MKFESNIPISESYADAILLFKTDAYRFYGQKSLKKRIHALILSNRGLRFLFFFRMAQYHGWAKPLFLRLSNYYAYKYGLIIYPETKIGYGLYLGHALNIVINSQAIIGNNVNLSHGDTIGSNTAEAPVVGDNVYLAPNVCVIGNCHISSNTTIGAGAVVTRDIQANKTAVGVPAIVVGDNHPEYIGNAIPLDEFKKMALK